MWKHHSWKIITAIIILALGSSIVYAQYVSQKANEGVTVTPHLKGNPDATVKLVEYSDFECPACGQFYPYVEDILTTYGDRISLEYKHFPLVNIHRYAAPAALASEAAAQQGKFWEYYTILFLKQSEWSKSTNPQQYFEQYATELGLDVDLFLRHQESSVLKDSITVSFNEARDLGLTGTPSFFLNGEKLQFTTFEEFRSRIDEAVGGQGN